jgi:aldose 1-epimerase
MSHAALIVTLGSFLSMTAYADVQKSAFGKTRGGQAVDRYTLKSGSLEVDLITYGARITRIRTLDRKGQMGDVVLGYDDLAAYENDTKTYFGAIVGRYGNRIGKGRFTLDGKSYGIPANNGDNALHGGPVGFDRKVWSAKEVPNGVEMTLVSADGDQGFPGTLTVHVRYTLEGNALRIGYTASTDKPTVVNLTNHAYFNLGGDHPRDVLAHELTIPADRYTPVDAGLIPLGNLQSVEGTPFDFRRATAIGARIGAADEQLRRGGGYDHNWVLNGSDLKLAARVHDPATGRTLLVETTEPGVQFYSGNFLDGTLTGHNGVRYAQRFGLCLETQHFPDSPNRPNFPSTVLLPGQALHSETLFRFSTEK